METRSRGLRRNDPRVLPSHGRVAYPVHFDGRGIHDGDEADQETAEDGRSRYARWGDDAFVKGTGS